MLLQEGRLRPLILDILIAGNWIILFLRGHSFHSLGVVFGCLLCSLGSFGLILMEVLLGGSVHLEVSILHTGAIDSHSVLKALPVARLWSRSEVILDCFASVLDLMLTRCCLWSMEILQTLGCRLILQTVHAHE